MFNIMKHSARGLSQTNTFITLHKNMASDVKFEFSPRSYNTNPVANDDEKRNQRRNKLFRRIQMDIKVTLQNIK